MVLATLALALWACGSDCDDSAAQPPIGVLSAFPAELAAVLAHVTVEETVTIDGRIFRTGTIGRTPVVVAMTGIGLVNATETTRALLDRFDVRGVVFSGVAGSTLRIADVTVPDTWKLVADGSTYPADPSWLARARQLTAPGRVALEECTVVPASGESVCLLQPPVIAVGGVGQSSDTFGEMAFACHPGAGDVFGCDVEPDDGAVPAASVRRTLRTAATGADVEPIAVDNETAAVAREVAARRIPFLGFRGVSDGEGDPLMLPGFPAQFFAYYRLAAHNAAAAAAAFLEHVP